MLRPLCLSLVLAGTTLIACPIAPVCAQVEDDEYTKTLVDLRDLNSALPQVDDSEHRSYMRGILNSFTERSHSGPTVEDLRGLSSMSREIAEDGFDTPASLLIEQFQATGAFDLTSQQVMPGIFFFEGARGDIARLTDMLEQVYDMHRERVELEVACHVLVEKAPPAIGSRFEGGDIPLMRTRQVVTRRVESTIEVLEHSTFVSDWQPVVGDQSIGYDSETAQVDYGLSTRVIVGRNSDTQAMDVRLRGMLTDLYVQRAEGPSVDGTLLSMGLPKLSVRSIQTDISARIGEPTVAAVVPGFEPEDSIVITIRVRPVSS